MPANSLTRRMPCPRCKLGFIIIEGSFDGESSCINCGHHLPSPPALEWLRELGANAPLSVLVKRPPPVLTDDLPPA